MKTAYYPTGKAARSRQDPKRPRTDEEMGALINADQKRRRRAARMFKDSALWPEPEPTESPGKTFKSAIEKRLRKRAKKAKR